MYVRRGISVRWLVQDSWRFLVVVIAWSVLIVYVHEIRQNTFVSIPMAPITIIGIAVSLYLGFKNTSAYNRWWEARTLWGRIVTDSRSWALYVLHVVHDWDKELDPAVRRELIERHLAWVNALVHQLRSSTRLKESRVAHVFGHRRLLVNTDFHHHSQDYLRYLSDDEGQAIAGMVNRPLEILRRQSERLHDLAHQGFLDNYRHVAMMALIDEMLLAQGGCERIKYTPFPRQIANFGQGFTWAFVFLLPLGLIDVFEVEARIHEMGPLLTHEYLFTMVPLSVLVSWIFFVMEKVSDSVEDPFEGGVTDVPISTLCRVIEIELRQMLGDIDLPKPLEPLDGVLY